MRTDHVFELAIGGALAGLVLLWLTSPAKAEPAPNPAPGPSVPPLGKPKPIPIPMPAGPEPDMQAGHWYLVTVTTAGPISDTTIADRVGAAVSGAEVGKWWRINDQTFCFTIRPMVTISSAAVAGVKAGGNVQIEEVNAWDDGPS
jgi:hypothetical protein